MAAHPQHSSSIVRHVPVSPAIIEQSARADSGHCMIADAIKAAMPQMTGVSVDLQTIRFSDRAKGKRYIYLTPRYAQEQLIRFDQGLKPLPWTMILPAQPAQVVTIKTAAGTANVARRPTAEGPRKVIRNHVNTVVGGAGPPLAVLAHSSHGGANRRGQTRVFGIRAAEGFNPYQPQDE